MALYLEECCMLNIIINECKQDVLNKHFGLNKIIFINDGHIYSFINGDAAFAGKVFSNNTASLEEFGQALLELNNKFPAEDIVVHTFNPLILNLFSDEQAKEFFVYYDKKRDCFKPVFTIKSMLEKLQYMSAGDAVAETDSDNLR